VVVEGVQAAVDGVADLVSLFAGYQRVCVADLYAEVGAVVNDFKRVRRRAVVDTDSRQADEPVAGIVVGVLDGDVPEDPVFLQRPEVDADVSMADGPFGS
jgi:hypothetical protein